MVPVSLPTISYFMAFGEKTKTGILKILKLFSVLNVTQ